MDPFASLPDAPSASDPFAHLPDAEGAADPFAHLPDANAPEQPKPNALAAARQKVAGEADPNAQHAAGDAMRASNITDPRQVEATYDAYRAASRAKAAAADKAAHPRLEFIAGQNDNAQDKGPLTFTASDGPSVESAGQRLDNAVTPEQEAQTLVQGDNAAERLGKGLGGGVAGPVGGLVGLLNPQAGRNVRMDYATSGAAGRAGGILGGLVNAPLAMTPAGQALSAVSAAGNKRVDIAERRAAGEEVSGGAEALNAAGAGAVDYATNRAAMNALGNTMGAAGTPLLKRLGAEVGNNVLIAQYNRLANSVVNRLTSHDKAPITSGDEGSVLEAAGQALAFAGAHGVAEHTNALRAAREKTAAMVRTDATPTPEPADHSGLDAMPVPASEKAPSPDANALKAAREKAAAEAVPWDEKDDPANPPEPFEHGASFKGKGRVDREPAGMTMEDGALQDDAGPARPTDSRAAPQVKEAPADAATAQTVGPEPERENALSRARARAVGRSGHVIVPEAVQNFVEAARDTHKEIDRSLGLGHRTPKEAADAALSIRKSVGDATVAAHKFEAELTPERKHFDAIPEVERTRWMDEVEKGFAPSDPTLQPAADIVKAMRGQNADRAAKLGIKLDAEGEGLSRMFEFPDAKKKGKGVGLAGTNDPFRSQKFDTYSDALKAVTAAGGKARYENPLDAQIARQYEVEKNLTARENLRNEENRKNVEWVKERTKPENDGFDTKLKDPILGTETRRGSLPKWMASKFSKLEGYEATKYLDDHEHMMKPVRPGEKPEAGYSLVPKDLRGQYHSTPDTAQMFNNYVSTGAGDPVVGLGQKIMRASVKFRYDLNGSHAVNGMMTGMVAHLRDAIGRATGGDLTGAAKSLADAATGGAVKGHQLRHAMMEGKGGDVGDRVAATGADLHLRSVTDVPKLKAMHEAFKQGNLVGGVAEAAKFALHTFPHDVIFKRLLPDILAGHAATVAENQIGKGVTPLAGRAKLAQEADTLSKAIGLHYQRPEFQRTLARQILNFILPASGYLEGRLGVAHGALKGQPAAWGLLSTGAVATAALGIGIQKALNGDWSADPRDWFAPKTGKKDANGHDERVTLPGPFAWAFRLATHPVNELKASVNPAIPATVEAINNKDWQGNQVRPDDGSTAGNVARTAWHIGKGSLPGPVTEAVDAASGKQPHTLKETALGLVGAHVGHPVTSAAEQHAYDLLDARSNVGGRNLADQKAHADQKRWVEAVRAGGEQRSAAHAEMAKDPSMTAGIRQSVERRAKNPEGLAGLVTDTEFKVGDLQSIWDKATPAERKVMQKGMELRVTTSKPGNQLEAAKWRALREEVKAVK